MTQECPKLTKQQAAVIGAYTGFTAGPFADIHEYAERILGRPIFTHEFASKRLSEEIRKAAESDYVAICFKEDE